MKKKKDTCFSKFGISLGVRRHIELEHRNIRGTDQAHMGLVENVDEGNKSPHFIPLLWKRKEKKEEKRKKKISDGGNQSKRSNNKRKGDLHGRPDQIWEYRI